MSALAGKGSRQDLSRVSWSQTRANFSINSGIDLTKRDWLTDFLASGFLDSFREIDTSPEKYSWWSYRAGARSRNMGWRIDYHLINKEIAPKLKHAAILNDIIHSDHCPVLVELI